MHAATPQSAPTELVPAGRRADALADVQSHVEIGEVVGHHGRHIALHRGVQGSLGRRVLVLVPTPDAPRQAVDALRAQAQRMARLAHPNIMPVHAILDEDDEVRILLAAVPGDTWEQRLSQPHHVRSAFGASDVLAWHIGVLLQVCRAIAHAHKQGVLHGDLRPEAVWIGNLGEVYVADWTWAGPLSEATHLGTDTVEALTDEANPALLYLPPERLVALAGPVDQRADVYQLGGLLYRILTGDGPHGDEAGEDSLRRALFQNPGFPSEVPPSLARVCKRALSRNVEARYPTVEAFRQALHEAFAQRGAWRLAAEADSHFDELQRLLRCTPVDHEALHRTYGALRLGYEHALAEAPGLSTARLRLDHAVELVVDHLIHAGDLAAAQAVLAHVRSAPPHLMHELEQALAARTPPPPIDRVTAHGRSLDPRRDGARRIWLAAVLGLVWVPSPLLLPVVHDPWLPVVLLLGLAGNAAFAVGMARLSSADQAESRLTRDLAAWCVWGTTSLAVLVALAALGGVPVPLMLGLTSAGAMLIVGTAAFSLDARLALPALAYGVLAVATVHTPIAWAAGTFVANLLLAAVLATEARHARR